MAPRPSPPTPPDRSHIATEQRHRGTTDLHRASVARCVELINDEDATVPAAVRAAAEHVARFIEAVEPGFAAGGRLIYAGAGTSGRLGVLDASECPPTFQVEATRVVGIIAGGDTSLRRSSEGAEDDPEGAALALAALALTQRDAVLGIAAGGTTPYVLGALRAAKRECPRVVTGLLVCTDLPEAPADVDHLLVVGTGAEVLTGSTRMKAGTATKLVLNTISTTLMVRCGRVYQNLMVDLRASNDKLRDRAMRIIGALTALDRAGAARLLDDADGSVKVAVVMQRRGLDRAGAQAALQAAGGRLDRALGE